MAEKKKTRKRTTKKAPAPIDEQWKKALGEAPAPVKNYSMQESFATGEVIDHPTFGKGVVLELIDHNKIKILFETAVKILIHAPS